MLERKQFTFYDSFYTAISRIKKPTERAAAYDTICAYALRGIEPDLEKLPASVAIAFELTRPTLDSSRRKAESGKKGGASKQTESKTEANVKQTASKKENKKENKKEGEKEKEIEDECPPPTPSRFVPPTLEEVTAYCRERNSPVDPKRFYDYFTTGNWKDAKGKPVKNWKQKLITWESNSESHGHRDTGFQTGNPFLEMLEERRGSNDLR